MVDLPLLPKPRFQAATGYDDAIKILREIAEASAGVVTIDSAGTTRGGREMIYAKLGTGPERIWVQCRGRGPQKLTTPAGLEVIDALASEAYALLRQKFTLLLIPVFHTDCTDSNIDYTEGDAVDLEKDWANFHAPESRKWFSLWVDFKPEYVLNIHQMGYYDYIEGTTIQNSFQVFTNLLRPEEFFGDQWEVSRRIGIVACDAVAKLGEPPARFWNERWWHLNDPRHLSNQAMMLQGFRVGDKMQRVRGTVYFEVRKDHGHEHDAHLVRLHLAAILSVIQAIADGSLHRVPLERYEQLPYGIHYGRDKPAWVDSGDIPEWVVKKEYTKEFVASFIRAAIFRGGQTEHPEIAAAKAAGKYKQPY